MEALVEEVDDIKVVKLRGRLEYESAVPFRSICMSELRDSKVVFDLSELNFVGSRGITPFLQTVYELRRVNQKGVRFCRVGVEFQRMIESHTEGEILFFDSVYRAKLSLDLAAMPTIIEDK